MVNDSKYTLNIFAGGQNHRKEDIEDIVMQSLGGIKDVKCINIESIKFVESGNMKMPDGRSIDGTKYKVIYTKNNLVN